MGCVLTPTRASVWNAGSSDGGTTDSEKETKEEEKEGSDKNGKIEAAMKNGEQARNDILKVLYL